MAMKFYPGTITINAGDTIVWKHNAGKEPHTVTFMGPETVEPGFVVPEPSGNGPPRLRVNPLVFFPAGGSSYDGSSYTNSGAMAENLPGPKQYQLTFAKPGTYDYICLLHTNQLPDGSIVGMKAKVVVQAAGSAYPKTQAQIDTDAQAEMSADEQTAKATEPEADTKNVSTRPGPNGTTIHHINVGYASADGMLEYMRFGPSDLTINQGDTVEWSSLDPDAFHTVTLGAQPDTFLVEPQQGGPPKVYFNPQVAFPAGGNTYNGTGYVNSSPILGPGAPPSAGLQSYSLTFTAPGTYKYICAIHDEEGMIGHITVLAAAGGTPGMPSTGRTDSTPFIAGLLALALLLGGLIARRRVFAR